VEHFASGDTAPRSATECAKTLRTPLDNVFYRDTETNEIVSDHTVPITQYSECIKPTTLTTLEKKTSEQYMRPKEALVFIHGINNSLDDAIRLCGQLLARGDFPAEIHPFVFSWAGGNFPLVSYWNDKQCAESDEVATALETFVASIVDAGYSKINFVTHSMGTRVFLNTVERHKFKNLFYNSSNTTLTASISTVTLCSPEFPLARFVAADGTFDVLREYCSHVTIYGDEQDLALRISEFTNRDWRLCGPRILSLGCNVKSVARDPSFPCKPIDIFSGAFDVASNVKSSLAAINEAAGFRHVASFTVQCLPQPLVEPEPPIYGSMHADFAHDDPDTNVASNARLYLDVDVINTSFTDTNVGSNRHSYFRLNESIVEDIREIILHKRRAKGRAGLMHQRGNAFIFLTAPKDVE
jgi:pimeloyl-ACP methyl ester carboxylesterase